MKIKNLKNLSKILLNLTKTVSKVPKLHDSLEPGIIDLGCAIDDEVHRAIKKRFKRTDKK